MKDQQTLGQAIGFLATICLIFLMCYTFQITNTPFFFLLSGLMSFGYMLVLLALLKKKNTPSFYLYFLIGILIIMLCIGLSFSTPHEGSLFF